MKRRSHKISVGIIAAAGALMMLALPAGALSGSGSSGSGTLTTDLTLQQLPSNGNACAVAGDNFGATTTFSSATIGTYSGPLTIDWTVDQANGPWYEGPEGTHGTQPACSNGSYGNTWDITGTATGSHGNTTVSCTFTSGTYSRTNDIDVSVTLTGTCSVNGGTATATTITLTTTLGTCYDTGGDPYIPEYCDTSDSFTAA